MRKNSQPYPFRNFRGGEPTTEDLRKEVEKVYQYIQSSLDNLTFDNIGGNITSNQAIFVSEEITSVLTTMNEADEALVEKIEAINAIIKDPRTGLAAAHARIALTQRVSATTKSALASQISIVSATVGKAQASIVEERTARVAADGTISADLITEVAARLSGDTTLSASITTEQSARISADGVITASLATEVAARSSGDSTLAASITTEQTARINGDNFVIAGLNTEVAARISGDNTLSASITSESTARATADGNLSAKYTLQATVSSGGVRVVTGMNITSAIDGGTNISKVVFQAADFQIWNSTPDTGVAMFDISGSNVRLAGTLVVSTSGKVFIGAGNYANSDTAFYVDSSGNFSLEDKLAWNAGTSSLSVNGSITSSSGTIGGFTLSSSDLTASNIELSSTGPRFRVGAAAAERASLEIVSFRARLAVYNGINSLTGVLQGNDGTFGGGFLQLMDSGGTAMVSLFGESGIGVFEGAVRTADGSTSLPGFAFADEINTGIRRNSSGDMRFVCSGSDVLVTRSGAVVCLVPLKLNNTYVAGAPTATGYLTIEDFTGTTYKLLVGT